MGVKELREAFNAVSGPFQAEKAFLSTWRDEARNREMTILSFSGIGPNGEAFDAYSDPLPGGTDVNLAAREVAQKLIQQHADQQQGAPNG